MAGLWISTGVVMQGFDMVAGGQLAALPAFQKQFGAPVPDGSYMIPAHYLSTWNAIAPACEILSTFICAPLLERYGRKPGILAASIVSVAGVVLQQLATDWRVHLAGRGVNGGFRCWFLPGNPDCARDCNWTNVYYCATVDRRDMSARAARLLSLLLQY
jgi:MFS family permease